MKIKIIGLLALFSFVLIASCQSEEDLNLNQTPTLTNQHQETIKVSAGELMGLLHNPDVKNSVHKNSIKTKSLDTNNENQDTYFTKVHLPEYDTYTLLVEDYTETTPYYKFFIVTVNNTTQKDNSNEVGFYAQYVPSERIDGKQPFNISRFVGALNIFDLDHIQIGGGSLANESATGIVEICKTTLVLTQITCSHSGEHNVGDTCLPPLVNDAHYIEVEVKTDCYTRIKYIGGSSSGGAGALPSAGSIFLDKLSSEDRAFLDANVEVRSSVLLYLETTTDNDTEAYAFANELISIGKYFKEEYGELGNDELNAIRMTRETKLKGYFTAPFDENYYNLIDTYVPSDLKDQTMIDPLHLYYTMQCAILKSQHPEWSRFRVYAVAALELIHVGLDIAGLVPAFGEFADLTNGVIYSIEGDGLNASLSFAATIPFAGWTATGTKYALTANKCRLAIRASDNLISFGSRESRKFRKLCGLSPGNSAFQAHHLVSRAQNILDHPVVQKAASVKGFHIDEVYNGIAVATWRNQPNHSAYNTKIFQKLEAFRTANPNATGKQCYDELMDIIADAKHAVINNPNVHLNNLIF